jgi:hypothetical protein
MAGVDLRAVDMWMFARSVGDMRSLQKGLLVPSMERQKKRRAAAEKSVDRYIEVFFSVKEGKMDALFQSLKGFNGLDMLIAHAVVFGLYYLFREGKRR